MTAQTSTPAHDPMIFVNLPSTDIARARAFYAGLGFSFDERFCNADSLMVGVSNTMHLMILDREKFASFAPRPVAPEGTVGALVCLSQTSAEAVDAFVTRALAHQVERLRKGAAILVASLAVHGPSPAY